MCIFAHNFLNYVGSLSITLNNYLLLSSRPLLRDANTSPTFLLYDKQTFFQIKTRNTKKLFKVVSSC